MYKVLNVEASCAKRVGDRDSVATLKVDKALALYAQCDVRAVGEEHTLYSATRASRRTLLCMLHRGGKKTASGRHATN